MVTKKRPKDDPRGALVVVSCVAVLVASSK